MPGLSRFSNEEIKRMKRLNFNEGKSYSSIAQIINHDRSSDNEIWDKICYNSASVTDISMIFASNEGFWCRAIKWCQSNSTTTDPCCHRLGPKPGNQWPWMTELVRRSNDTDKHNACFRGRVMRQTLAQTHTHTSTLCLAVSGVDHVA